MSTETASALTDVLLAGGTAFLGFSVGKRQSYRTWTAFFLMMGLSAGFGSIFHGTVRFHNDAFWVLVAVTSASSACLFLAAIFSLVKPSWKWLHWMWPLMGIIGMFVGAELARFPFWYISIFSAICVIVALLLLKNCGNKTVKNWIYAGVAVTIFGMILQAVSHGEGLSAPGPLYHLFQLAGNVCLWMGARRS